MLRITIENKPDQRTLKLERILLAVSCSALLACAAGEALGQGADGLPERRPKKVAPGPAPPWRAPDLRGYSNALKPAEQPIDPARQYDLAGLIGVARRVNPETRIPCERP